MPESTHPAHGPLAKQPNSLHCFVCGIANACGLQLKFYQSGNEVFSNITVPEQYQGYPGVVHGGIVAAMLDEAAGRAHMLGDPPRFMFTGRIQIRYRQNVPVGRPLRLVGRAVKSRSRAAESVAEIYDEAGSLLASAEVLLVDVPAGIVNGVSLEELGWKVYEDPANDQAAGERQ